MGLVGLYACSVRRLRTEKRKPAHFISFIGFLGLLQLLRSLSRFVLLLLCSCCLCASLVLVVWVVLLVVFFPFGRYDKKKGRTVLALPLFVRGLFPLLLFGFNP